MSIKKKLIIFLCAVVASALIVGLGSCKTHDRSSRTHEDDAANKQVTLYLVRHAETDANVRGLLAGSGTDVMLTDHGKKQAIKTGACLAKVKFDSVYTSELTRTKDTASLIMKENKTIKKKLKFKTLKGLNDINWGELEGKTIAEASNADPNFNLDSYLGNLDDDNFKPDFGIESRGHLCKRFDQAFDEIISQAKDKDNILVVSHSSMAWWLNKSVKGIHIDYLPNASVTKVVYENGHFKK